MRQAQYKQVTLRTPGILLSHSCADSAEGRNYQSIYDIDTVKAGHHTLPCPYPAQATSQLLCGSVEQSAVEHHSRSDIRIRYPPQQQHDPSARIGFVLHNTALPDITQQQHKTYKHAAHASVWKEKCTPQTYPREVADGPETKMSRACHNWLMEETSTSLR